MSNEKQWTWNQDDESPEYFTANGRYATPNDIVNALNAADSTTARVAELEAQLKHEREVSIARGNLVNQSDIRIYELEAQLRKTEWVSVEERVPDDYTSVLVLLDDGSVVDAMYCDDADSNFTSTHFKSDDRRVITHWKVFTPPQNTKGDEQD